MIVGCYTLDLYCREAKREHKYGDANEVGTGKASFYGNNITKTREQARKAGWKFVGDDVLCPACVKLGIK